MAWKTPSSSPQTNQKMKTSTQILTKALSIVICLSLTIASKAQQKKSDLPTFMLGKWEMITSKGKITESWTKTRYGMTGKSYQHQMNGDSILTESVDIKMINNTWHYCVTGHQKGNEGTTNFKLVSIAGEIYVFENKSHDFPQRIVYQNKGKNAMTAWIEGEIGGKLKKSEFPYHRSK